MMKQTGKARQRADFIKFDNLGSESLVLVLVRPSSCRLWANPFLLFIPSVTCENFSTEEKETIFVCQKIIVQVSCEVFVSVAG